MSTESQSVSTLRLLEDKRFPNESVSDSLYRDSVIRQNK